GEAAPHSVPHVPNERRLVEELAMAIEEFISKPGCKVVGLGFFGREQVADRALAIVRPPDGADQLAQSRRRARLADEAPQRDDAVGIDKTGSIDLVRLQYRGAIQKGRSPLARPVVAKHSRDGDLQRVLGHTTPDTT